MKEKITNISVDEELYGEFSDINDINDEYISEFGSESAMPEVDVKPAKEVVNNNIVDDVTEIKNSMKSFSAASQPAYHAYSPDSFVFNEVARLRDELTKTQMQSEIDKLRDELHDRSSGRSKAYDEIAELKAQLNMLKATADTGSKSYSSNSNDVLNAIYALEQKVMAAFENLSSQLAGEIKFAENEDIADVFQALKDLRNDINSESASYNTNVSESVSSPNEVNLFLSEIVSLRDELQEYKDSVSELVGKISGTSLPADATLAEQTEVSEGATMILDELMSIKAEVGGYNEEIENLKLGIADIKNIVRAGVISNGEGTSNFETAVVLTELSEIKSKLEDSNFETKIDELKQQVTSAVENSVSSASPQVAQLPSNIYDTLNIIVEEVRAAREEPDYGVMQEVLVLREEFNSLKDKIVSGEVYANDYDHETAKSQIIDDIKNLREQLFALELVKVEVANGEVAYENFNNVLLEEISNVQQSVTEMKDESMLSMQVSTLQEEVQSLKDELTAQKDANAEMMNIIKAIAGKLEV